MDLAIGAKQVFVMMTLFAKDGAPKLVPECTYPLTGVGCVDRVYTDLAVFDVGPDGARLVETFGITVDELASRAPRAPHRVAIPVESRMTSSVGSAICAASRPARAGWRSAAGSRRRPARPRRARRPGW